MTGLRVSIIMLTYNRIDMLKVALKGIQAQTESDYELIIVDNGSNDGTSKFLDEYARDDKRIVVIHIPKSSIAKGRETGLVYAKGEYITFVDDDDLMYSEMLKFLLNLADTNDADIAICGSHKQVQGKIMDNCVFNELMIMNGSEAVVELLKRKKYNAALPTKLIKRSIFSKVKFREDCVHEDIFCTYKVIANAKKIVAYGIPQYCFVRHENNISGFTSNDKLITPKQLEEYFDAFKERTEYLSSKLPDIAEYARYSELSFMISMCNKIHLNNLVSCSKQLKYVEEELVSNYDQFYESKYIQDFEREYMDKYIRDKATN